MQPNTWKHFPFPKISISGKYVFFGKRFTATKHSLNLFYWRGRSRLAGIKHTFYTAWLYLFIFRTINGMSKFRSTFVILGYFNFDALSLIAMWRLWWLFAICWSLIGHFEWCILSHHQGDVWGKPKIGYYFISQVCVSTISFHSGITLRRHAYLVSFLFQVWLVSNGCHWTRWIADTCPDVSSGNCHLTQALPFYFLTITSLWILWVHP